MPHCEAQWLALRALGEHQEGPDDDHLAACPRCRSELDQIAAVVHASRTVTPADQPVQPSPLVWDRITAELEPTAGAATAAPAGPLVVLPLRRRAPWLLAVAAVLLGLLVGAAVTTAVTDRRDGAVVATAALASLPDKSGAGTAVLHEQGGNRLLDVDVAGLPARTDAFYEVWLLAPDGSRLVSLGVLDPTDRGRFELPAGLDLAQYPVVDVSIEPYDGNPAHSKDSVVRGELPA